MNIFLVKYSINGWRISPITSYTEEFCGQRIFIKQYTKLIFCSKNSFFIVTHPKMFRQIYLIRELWRLLKPGMNKLGLSNVNHERKHKLIMDLWVLTIYASNFTLCSISFIFESLLLFAKHFFTTAFSSWTRYSFYFIYFCLVCSSLMTKHFVKTLSR